MSFDERLVTRLLSIDGSADAISALSNYIQLLDDAPGSVASWWEALQRALAGPDSGGNLAVALPLLHLCHELLVRGARARSQVYAAAFAAQLERAMAAAARALPAAQLQSLQRLPGLWRERAIFSPRFAGVLAAAVEAGLAERGELGGIEAGTGRADAVARAPSSAATAVSEEQVAVVFFAGLTPSMALGEAQRRRVVVDRAAAAADAVDAPALAAAAEAAAKKRHSLTAGGTVSATAAAAASAAASASLARLAAAERTLRASHALLRANAARRNGLVAKLGDCLAAAADRAAALGDEAAHLSEVETRLRTLLLAAEEGKTVLRARPRLHGAETAEFAPTVAAEPPPPPPPSDDSVAAARGARLLDGYAEGAPAVQPPPPAKRARTAAAGTGAGGGLPPSEPVTMDELLAAGGSDVRAKGEGDDSDGGGGSGDDGDAFIAGVGGGSSSVRSHARDDAPFIPVGGASAPPMDVVRDLTSGKKYDRARGWVDADADEVPGAPTESWRD